MAKKREKRLKPPKDGWAKRLYGDNGLTDKSTMADIEPKAKRLLSQPDTALTGAELTLGRRIDGGEKIANLFAMPGLDEGQKFALLLLQKRQKMEPSFLRANRPHLQSSVHAATDEHVNN